MDSFNAKTLKLILLALVLAAALAGVALAVTDRGSDRTRELYDEDKGEVVQSLYPPVERAPAEDAEGRPNVLLIITDDQNLAEVNRRYMPQTMRLLGDEGTVFEEFVVASPVCCPSRVTTLTGTYPHNNGVFSNRNGWARLADERNNLGSWMQRAGYRTAWIGKFLQGYKNATGNASIPAPGFDEWLVSVHPRYRGYLLHAGDGKKLKGGKGPRAYYTDKLTRKARKLIAASADKRRPLFMVLNHLAPHRGAGGKGRCANTAAPAQRDFGRFDDEPLRRPPSFGRWDRQGQRAFTKQAGLRRKDIKDLENKTRCRAESLLAADRSVAAIVRTLEQTGELDNTVILYTSDNGLLLGEHGLTGKSIPYEEGIRMPLLMRIPEGVLGTKPVSKVAPLTANVDLAPTLLEFAGAEPCVEDDDCRTLDGRSLVPLLRGDDADWPHDRAIPIEGGAGEDPCAYRGLRLPEEVLLERVVDAGDGDCERRGLPELYDLRSDPYQLRNLAVHGGGPERARLQELEERLDELERCAGIEGRDERVDDRPFCD